jgi:hypothetical protein
MVTVEEIARSFEQKAEPAVRRVPGRQKVLDASPWNAISRHSFLGDAVPCRAILGLRRSSNVFHVRVALGLPLADN